MDERTLDRGFGAVLGALVGDAAGAYLEFIGHQPSADEVEGAMQMPGGGCWKVAPGQVTDDGELMLCLAQALFEGNDFDIERHARLYARWYESPPFDIGNTTAASIGCISRPEFLKMSQNEGFAAAMTKAAQRDCMGSKANGSLMRAAPIGVWGYQKTDAEIARVASLDSGLSHPHESCCHAVAAYSIAIAELVKTGDRAAAWARAKNWLQANANAELKDWAAVIESNEQVPGHPQAGFVRIAFINAFQSLIANQDYQTAIRSVLSIGGDTDTNACIVGGLIGAATGAGNIPATMGKAVINCDTSEGRHPRPDFLHPGKVLPRIRSTLAKLSS
jgi:ADP-ribosylglycohydrolase